MAGAPMALDSPVLDLFTFSVISMFSLLYQDLALDVLHHPAPFALPPQLITREYRAALPKLSVTAATAGVGARGRHNTQQHSSITATKCTGHAKKKKRELSAPIPAGKARQQVRCKHHFAAQRLSEARRREHAHVHKTPPRGHASIWPLLATPAYLKCLTLQMLWCRLQRLIPKVIGVEKLSH